MQAAQTGGGTGADLQTDRQTDRLGRPDCCRETEPSQVRRRDSNALYGLKCGDNATRVLILSVDGLHRYQSRVTDLAD